MAWGNAGAAFAAVGENFSGLTSSTMAGWQGDAGDGFRTVMAAAAGAFVGASQAALYVSGVAANIAMVSQAACMAIGKILKRISEELLRMAAEAAIPVAGWAAAAVETVITIQDVIAGVKLSYTIIKAIVDVIDSFVGAQQQVVQSLGVIEDLAEYATRRAMA